MRNMTDFRPFRSLKSFKIERILNKRMTVCIAAICDLGTKQPKLVLCADRLVSAGVQFEHNPKLLSLPNKCWIMSASSDSAFTDMITMRSLEKLGLLKSKTKINKLPDIMQLTQLLAKECNSFQLEQMERTILSRYGLTLKEFREASKTLSEQLIARIADDIYDYEPEFMTQYVVAGFDSEATPHIFVIERDEESGEYIPKTYDSLGFAAIGIAEDMAFSEMTKAPHHSRSIWQDTLIRVYTAKRLSERVSGVGKETDLVLFYPVIGANGKNQIDFTYLDMSVVFNILDEVIKLKREKEAEIDAEERAKLTGAFVYEEKTKAEDEKSLTN